jgi:DNA-directed RNA polymerase specialized sigma24 family protein
VRELSLEDRERFEQFVLPYVDAAFNLARWLLRERSDAEDVTQDALLRANRFFCSFHGSDARAWLMKIIRNRLAAGKNGILRRLGRRPCRPGTAPPANAFGRVAYL